jgi:hypothetical protein
MHAGCPYFLAGPLRIGLLVHRRRDFAIASQFLSLLLLYLQR